MTDRYQRSTGLSGQQTNPDVFIAGAGPAGLACAVAAAQQGLSVTIVDGMSPPIDKACGEGLLPDTVALLESLGISLSALPSSISSPFQGIRFIGPPRSRQGTRKGIRAEGRFHKASGLGIERILLHQLLLERALSLGVRICWKTVVQSITRSSPVSTTIHSNRGDHTARFVVGADGHASRIRLLSGLDAGRTTSRRFGLRQHFFIEPWASLVEVYWSQRGEAYITPVADNKVCVAFLDRVRFTSVSEALTFFPELRNRLAGSQAADSPRGAVSVGRRLKRVTADNFALVGDASGSIDAITGQGLSLAFSQAIALASALRAGDLSAYQSDHESIGRLPAFFSGIMLSMDGSAISRNVILSALALHSSIFDTFLRIHARRSYNFAQEPCILSGKCPEIAPSALYSA